MNTKKYISLIVFILVLSAMGYFIYSDLRLTVDNEDSATTSPNGGDEIVEYLPDVEPPNLDREFVIPDIYSDEIKKNTIEQYNSIVKSLKEKPSLRDEWLQLALLRNTTEDYEGAEEIWIYMTQVRPLDAVSFGNLGHIYLNNLVDYKKAEINLIRALEINPTLTQNAQNLYDLYRFRQENPIKALDALIQIGSVVSNEIFYPLRIAEHYRDTGQNKKAKNYFETALVLAKEQELTDIEVYVNEEISKLN